MKPLILLFFPKKSFYNFYKGTRKKILATLALVLSGMAPLYAQMLDLELSGAGTAAVNGVYTYMGQYTDYRGESADYYQKGSIFIYRVSFKDFPSDPVRYWWRVSNTLGSSSYSKIYYNVSGSTQTHPVGLTFSSSSGLGSAPFPSAQLSANSWNGTSWSKGSAPTASIDVILNSNTSPGSFTASRLILPSGIDLTLSQGDTVTLGGDIRGVAKSTSTNGTLSNFALSGNSSNWVSGAGGTFSGTGSPANALSLDGSNDRIQIGEHLIGNDATYTIEAWVKPNVASASGGLYGEFYPTNSYYRNYLLLSGGKVAIDHYLPSGNFKTANTVLAANTWYHIAYVRNGNTQTIYVNGVSDFTDNAAETYSGNAPTTTYIGCRDVSSGFSEHLNATIDEFRFWDTVRTQAQIQASMNSELTGNESGLVAYYNFNQGTAGGANTGIATLPDNKVIPYDPNVISGSGTLVFDNSGETLSLDDVKINTEGVVQVSSGTTLQTNDSLTLAASSVSSYGQIIGDGTVLGNVSAQAWLDASTARYHYLGSPFTDATLEEFNEGQTMVAANSSQGTVWQWNAATAAWEPPTALTDVAANGKGYAMYAGTNSYGTFLRSGAGTSQLDGTVANGDVTVALGYNNGQSTAVGFVGGTAQTATEGWNFLANPYPSQYDWNGQSLPAGMSNAFYVNKGGSYASYVSGVGTNGGSQYLAPFQGFWVQTSNATAGNFTFEQDQRVTAPSTALMKAAPVDGVWLTLNDFLTSDEIFIGFDPQATPGFDAALDARKLLNGDTPNLSTQLNGELYSICRVGLNGISSFPLSLRDGVDGQACSFHLEAGQLNRYSAVYLEDKMLNVWHDVKSSDYNFVQNDAYGPDRFVLHFSSPGVDTEEVLAQPWYAYASDDGIAVVLGQLTDVSIEVYDLSGRMVVRMEGQEGTIHIPANGSRQLYIVKVRSAAVSGTQKIIR